MHREHWSESLLVETKQRCHGSLVINVLYDFNGLQRGKKTQVHLFHSINVFIAKPRIHEMDSASIFEHIEHWSRGYRDSAVSSQPRDSTDGFHDSRGHCENFESDPLHPVGTAQTWIRTLTSHWCDYLDNSPVCMPLHSATLSVDVISHLSEWLVGWTSSPSTRVFPLVGIIDTLPQSLGFAVTDNFYMRWIQPVYLNI